MVLGFLPFLRYFYAPLGAGDRVNVHHGHGRGDRVGAALLVAASRQRELAGRVGLAILAGVCLLARGERTELWATAGRRRRSHRRCNGASDPGAAGGQGIVLGPTPVSGARTWQRTSTSSNTDGAMRLAYGREDVKAYMSQTQEDFDSVPGARRVDVWGPSELDDLELLGRRQPEAERSLPYPRIDGATSSRRHDPGRPGVLPVQGQGRPRHLRGEGEVAPVAAVATTS